MNAALTSVGQSFGQALKAARAQRHVSIHDQCRALSVSKDVYEKWETDEAIPDAGQCKRIFAWERNLRRYKDALRAQRAASAGRLGVAPESEDDDAEVVDPPPGPAVVEVPGVFKKLRQRVRRQSNAEIDLKALRSLLGIPTDAKLMVRCEGIEDMELGKDNVVLHAAWEIIEDE